MEIQNTQKQTSSLRSKLLTVGVSGVVFVGGTLGLSSLASAQTGTDPAAPADSAVVAEVPVEEAQVEEGQVDEGQLEETDHDGVSFFDGLSDADQAIILDFEECLGDAGLIEEIELDEPTDADIDSVEVEIVELTDEEFDAIDAAFTACEPILDDLSFDADEWLGGDVEMIDGEDFEGCVFAEDGGDAEDADL